MRSFPLVIRICYFIGSVFPRTRMRYFCFRGRGGKRCRLLWRCLLGFSSYFKMSTATSLLLEALVLLEQQIAINSNYIAALTEKNRELEEQRQHIQTRLQLLTQNVPSASSSAQPQIAAVVGRCVLCRNCGWVFMCPLCTRLFCTSCTNTEAHVDICNLR